LRGTELTGFASKRNREGDAYPGPRDLKVDRVETRRAKHHHEPTYTQAKQGEKMSEEVSTETDPPTVEPSDNIQEDEIPDEHPLPKETIPEQTTVPKDDSIGNELMDVPLDKLFDDEMDVDVVVDDADAEPLGPEEYRHLAQYDDPWSDLKDPHYRITFTHREFAITLQNDAYLRYNSYSTWVDLQKDIIRLNPTRFEIGPIYSAPPKDRKSLPKASFKPIVRELVFDIDLTDYDDIRNCCSDKKICVKCWKFISLAIQVLDLTLRQDFGYRHLLWVYSGRRGAHCWVSDHEAMRLNDEERKAIVSYINILKGGGSKFGLKVDLKSPLHPMVERSLETLTIISFYKIKTFLKKKQNGNSFYGFGLIQARLIKDLEPKWTTDPELTSEEKWGAVTGHYNLSNTTPLQKKKLKETMSNVILHYTYPRIDLEVSKHLNHLLKSPFCVHPATGKVCVPLDLAKINDFDPDQVPDVRDLLRELDKHPSSKNPTTTITTTDQNHQVLNWYHTSLRPYVEFFQDHVNDLLKDRLQDKKAPPLRAQHSTAMMNQPRQQQWPYRRLDQHQQQNDNWEGTLSASLSDWLAYLRTSLFPKHYHYPPSSRKQLPPLLQKIVNQDPSQIWFIVLCSLWYSSSALSSNTGKAILTRFKYPVTLTIVQFGFVGLWSGICLALRHHASHPTTLTARHHHHGTTLLIQTLGLRIPNKATIRGTCIMSLFSIAGHVFSSMAISRVPVSTVHTIKALSPLFTVIAYAGLFRVRYGFNTYFSLLPLTLGVMLACSFDMRANGTGFLCALGSTIIFVSQNIYGKKLLPKESSTTTTPAKAHKRQSSSGGSSSNTQMDKLNLLFYSSTIAFLMMIPIWIYTDLGLLWSTNQQQQQILSDKRVVSDSISLTTYFVFNGTVHFGQCILAFSILSKTSPVTYSIASLIKRVAVICIAIIWFGQSVSIVQGFGMILTFVGLFIYNQAKAEIDLGEKRRGIIERRSEVLLPSNANDIEELPEEIAHRRHESIELKPLQQQQHQQPIIFDNPFPPSIPTPFSYISSSSDTNRQSTHHHHHQPLQVNQSLPSSTHFPTPALPPPPPPPPPSSSTAAAAAAASSPLNNARSSAIKSSHLQDSNSFRPVVNVLYL
ncbi:hypothetical protein PSTT_12765, partial [Puccinia striiformis]